MTKTYTSLKTILIDKITAIQGEGGVALFAGVYGVDETAPAGYPCAFVIERSGSGRIMDTHRNEREWQFSLVIHQEIGKKTAEEAYVVLLDAVDRVIAVLDQDPMLNDSNGFEQCKMVRVVPIQFEYASRDTTVHRALLIVSVVDLVNRYA